MWKEKLGQLKSSNQNPMAANDRSLNALSSFDAGAIFAKYDVDQDGKLNKKDFEELILAHPELLSNQNRENTNYNLPHEVITGRLLTHYDETAGVAIPRSAVTNHEHMGNTVRPLVQAYTERFPTSYNFSFLTQSPLQIQPTQDNADIETVAKKGEYPSAQTAADSHLQRCGSDKVSHRKGDQN
jgi:hypothetical protein